MSNIAEHWDVVKSEDVKSQDSDLLGIGAWTESTNSHPKAAMKSMAEYPEQTSERHIEKAEGDVGNKETAAEDRDKAEVVHMKGVAHHEVPAPLVTFSRLNSKKHAKVLGAVNAEYGS